MTGLIAGLLVLILVVLWVISGQLEDIITLMGGTS